MYARDGSGRVVGRQLIGVTGEGALVGFNVYTRLPEEAGNGVLRAIFRRYVAAFAARCRLPLADKGTVLKLFAEAWYDDGAVAWTDEKEKVVGARRTGSVRALTAPHPIRTFYAA